MLTKQDVDHLKSQVELAIEVLLRAADERINWKQIDDGPSPTTPVYTFLPGVYTTVPPQSAAQQPRHQEDSVLNAPNVSLVESVESHSSSISQALHQESLLSPTTSKTEAAVEGDGSKTQIILHGDNTFNYLWTMKRSGARAMEFTVEMEGRWTKPVLNRTRRGEEDHHISLSANRIRFQRLSNYDSETQTWKLCLRTLTRHGSDWANVGVAERGIPPIVLVFQCANGFLESTGAAQPAKILSNSSSCRILAGLTKKIANKLGAPLDVMTEKWLPARGLRIILVDDTSGAKIKQFNPFYCLAEALRSRHQLSKTEHAQSVSAGAHQVLTV